MINSKALKSLPKRLLTEECGCPEGDKHEHGHIYKVLRAVGRFYMFKIYYPIESFFVRLRERTARSARWAKFMYMNYDFDSHYVYSVMEFKYKDLYRCLENGHAIQDKVDMDALKETIKICGRLSQWDYEDKYHREHDKKWGKMPRWDTKPALDKDGKDTGNVQMIFKPRPKADTKRKENQERKEFRKIWEKGEKDRCADIDRLAELLKKHAPRWWD